MTLRFSLLHATRGTPQRALETRAKWLNAAKRPDTVEHVFGVQSDDSTGGPWLANHSMVATTPPPPAWASSSVANWNACAEIAEGEWLIVIADDLIPPHHWDELLFQDIIEIGPSALREPTVIQASDGVNNDWLLRHPVMNRALYQKRGYVFNPAFYGVFCDNDLTAWCFVNGVRFHAAKHFAVTHLHPTAGTRADDEICRIQNSKRAYEYGQETYRNLWPQTVARHIVDTHSVWIGPRLGLMERLTLTLLLKYGHRPTLWVQDGFDRSTVPSGVRVRTVPDDAVDPVGFAGIPHPGIPNGGIGSLAHWSDYFSALVLSVHGGLWVQLDVAALEPIHATEHCFTSWSGGYSPCVWSAPVGSEFVRAWGAFVEDGARTQWAGQDWHDCMHAINRLLQHTRTLHGVLCGPEYFDCGGRAESPFNRPLHDPRIKLIHWSNATHGQSKEQPVAGSFYRALCEREGLI